MSMVAVLFIVATLMLAGCGGGSGSRTNPDPDPPSPPDYTAQAQSLLSSKRFTTDQPQVLEQIGAHHAYARGLTGKGVRIGIQDSIIDYTQTAEFGDRVELSHAAGATLAYNHPYGDSLFSDVTSCAVFNPDCRLFEGNSEGDAEAVNEWLRQIVDSHGWPTADDSYFFVDEHYDEYNALERLFRWYEVPVPYGLGGHGTLAASTAAGTNFGVAPEATIIPIAKNFDDQAQDDRAEEELLYYITLLTDADRQDVDAGLAEEQTDYYSKFDIINNSWGTSLFNQDVIVGEISTVLNWYERYLPRYLGAALQVDTPDERKTIVVWASGNSRRSFSALEADLPYHISALRGHSLSVVATDPTTGLIADYSNQCGPLPLNWNAAAHGPHYCLAAPGAVRGLVPDPDSPGRGRVEDGIQGTSFAAPVVSGALALLMEHFRGTRGNTEIVRRMLDTADRSGAYADLETYGAGHLDLEAALTPVGTLTAGQSARALGRTSLQTPAAFGSLALRTASVELAAFDQQHFPFWVPLSSLLSSASNAGSPIPGFEGRGRGALPATGLDALGLHWSGLGEGADLVLPGGKQWVAGFGPTSVSLARRSDDRLGYGFNFSEGGYLGGNTSGAFGSDPYAGMAWASRRFTLGLGNGWSLQTAGTLAVSVPRYESGAIFEASTSLMSALSMRVGTEATGITVEQPLRAETGTGTFRVENGLIEDGQRLYDIHRVPLSPEAREVRMTFRHERDLMGGRVAFEIGGALNAGHVPGAEESRAGLAWRAEW